MQLCDLLERDRTRLPEEIPPVGAASELVRSDMQSPLHGPWRNQFPRTSRRCCGSSLLSRAANDRGDDLQPNRPERQFDLLNHPAMGNARAAVDSGRRSSHTASL